MAFNPLQLTLALLLLTGATLGGVLQHPIASSHVDYVHESWTDRTAYYLLQDLTKFSSDATELSDRADDVDEYMNKMSLIFALAAVSDQIDHINVSINSTASLTPVKDKDAMQAVQEAMVIWETRFRWAARDLSHNAPEVARREHFTDIAILLVNRMSLVFEAYCSNVLRLIPDDQGANIKKTKAEALDQVKELRHLFKTA